MNYEEIARHAIGLGSRAKLKLAQFLLQLAIEEEEQQKLRKRTPAQKARTAIDLDSEGFAAALDLAPLAERVEGVHKLCERHGRAAAGQRLSRSKEWISKAVRVARAVKDGKSVTGRLVVQRRIDDLETAYYLSKIESKSESRANEVASIISDERLQKKREAVIQAWEAMR